MISVKELSFFWGSSPVLNKVTFAVGKGQKVGLVGSNWSGKSTLIKILVGLLDKDTGELVKNEHLKVGYYSQEFESFDLNKTLLETLKESSHLQDNVIRPLLAKFLFPGDKVFQTISSLSGGEKTRLAILLLMLHGCFMDALKEYTGAMLIVSHTQQFIEELKPEKALLLPENKFDFWSEEYLAKVEEV